MNVRAPHVTLCLATALVVAAGVPADGRFVAQATAQSAKAPTASAEVRGLWVLRSSLTSAPQISEMVRTAVEGGYNTILVQVRGRGEAYYRSAIEPRASDLESQPASFDPLKTTIDVAHQAGLRVHAWVNINLVSSAAALPRSRGHIVARQPGWLMVPQPVAAELSRVDSRTPGYVGRLARWSRDPSNQMEGLYLSPVTAGSRAYTVAVVDELIRGYALDGLHLDYLRYPSGDFDYSQTAIAEFRSSRIGAVTVGEQQRLDRAARVDPLAWPKAQLAQWSGFRRDRLTSLVVRLRAVAKAARPSMLVSSAIIPNVDEARERRFQDWPAWVSAGLLDVLCPMAYSTELQEFTAQMASVSGRAEGTPVWAGIGAWRLPVGQVAEHMRAARRTGATGILLFSYDSLLTSGPSRGSYFTQLRPTLLEVRGDGQR